MSLYADKVKRGNTFIVVKKSKPLFKITQFDEGESYWEEVVDLTKIRRGGIPIKDLLKRLQWTNLGKLSRNYRPPSAKRLEKSF